MTKETTVIHLDAGLWSEWTSTERLETAEPFWNIVTRINIANLNDNKLIVVKLTNGGKRAINIDRISDIWIKEVE